MSVAIDSARDRLISGSGDATVRVWDTSPQTQRMTARAEYRAIETTLSERVLQAVENHGPADAAARLTAAKDLNPRELEIAVQLSIRAGLDGNR